PHPRRHPRPRNPPPRPPSATPPRAPRTSSRGIERRCAKAVLRGVQQRITDHPEVRTPSFEAHPTSSSSHLRMTALAKAVLRCAQEHEAEPQYLLNSPTSLP